MHIRSIDAKFMSINLKYLSFCLLHVITLLSTKYLKNEGFEPKNPHKQGNYFQKRKSSDLTFKNNFNKVLTFEFICAILNLCI